MSAAARRSRVPSRDSARLIAELMRRDIVTSHRDDNVRASFHFYNNEDDVESFVAALQGPARRARPAQARSGAARTAGCPGEGVEVQIRVLRGAEVRESPADGGVH